MNPFIGHRYRGPREPQQEIPNSDEERTPTEGPTRSPAVELPAAQEPQAQEPPVQSKEAAGPIRIVVQLKEMSAAARAEFRNVSPEVEPEDDDPNFVIRDHERSEDDEEEDGNNASDESDHRPPRRGQKRRKATSRARHFNEKDADNAPGPRKKRPRVKGIPKELSASMERFMGDLPHITVEAQHWMTTNLPRITGLSEVQRMLPRLPIAPAWSAKDRWMVDSDWGKFPQRKQLLDVAKNKDLLTLYKCCLRLMRCLPEDIISCRFNLRYDFDQNRALAKGQSLIWSGPFCKSLAALLVHPLWDGAVAALAAAIQYTVIVETNDNGPWVMEVPGWDEFLARLLDRKRKQPNKNADELRRQLHVEMTVTKTDELGRETGICLSRWDTLFHTIESLAASASAESSGQTPPPQKTRGNSEPFTVHRRHLDLLINALNSMTHMGFPLFMSLDIYNRGISGRRPVTDYPQAGDLHALREYSLICEHERLAYKDRLATVIPQTPDDPAKNDTQAHEGQGCVKAPDAIRDSKRQRPSQTRPLSLNHTRTRVRAESPSASKARTARNQLGSQPLDESPGSSSNSSRGDAVLLVYPGANGNLVDQNLESGDSEDIDRGAGNAEEKDHATGRDEKDDEGEGGEDEVMSLPEDSPDPQWHNLHGPCSGPFDADLGIPSGSTVSDEAAQLRLQSPSENVGIAIAQIDQVTSIPLSGLATESSSSTEGSTMRGASVGGQPVNGPVLPVVDWTFNPVRAPSSPTVHRLLRHARGLEGVLNNSDDNGYDGEANPVPNFDTGIVSSASISTTRGPFSAFRGAHRGTRSSRNVATDANQESIMNPRMPLLGSASGQHEAHQGYRSRVEYLPRRRRSPSPVRDRPVTSSRRHREFSFDRRPGRPGRNHRYHVQNPYNESDRRTYDLSRPFPLEYRSGPSGSRHYNTRPRSPPIEKREYSLRQGANDSSRDQDPSQYYGRRT